MQSIYSPGNSPLHRLHPLTKMAATALIVVAAYFLPGLLSPIALFLVVLLLALLLPHLDLISAPNHWLLPGFAVVISLTFIVLGSWTSGFNRDHPQPTNIFYALNADSGKAVWASTDPRLNNWTIDFFAEGLKTGAISD